MILSKSLLAIDIGSSSIKLVEIEGTSHKKVVRFGQEHLPPSAVANGMILDKYAVENTVYNLLRKLGPRKFMRRSAVSLGSSAVIVKKVNFNQSDDGNISELVYYEAEQHLQYDMNDLYFDFYVFDNEVQSSHVPVLLVGAKREIVDQYVAILKKVGLRVGVVDCDVFALTNAFEHSYGQLQGIVCVADIGSHSTQLVFIGNGQYLHSREIGIAGESFSKHIADHLKLSLPEAENMKISAGSGHGSSDPRITKLMQEVTQQFISEVQSATDFFFQSGDALLGANTLSGIFLAGGGARTSGLVEAISTVMQIPAAIMNPFQNVGAGKYAPPELMKRDGNLYGVAFGLSLRTHEGDSL